MKVHVIQGSTRHLDYPYEWIDKVFLVEYQAKAYMAQINSIIADAKTDEDWECAYTYIREHLDPKCSNDGGFNYRITTVEVV